jgi:5,6-dimethylbenzimidazole synthase
MKRPKNLGKEPSKRESPGTDDGLVEDARFDEVFRSSLMHLFQARRDVRHFKSTPVSIERLKRLVDAARLAPSVGLSEPWRWVLVESESCRNQIVAEFEHSNTIAANAYADKAIQTEYARLKLAGLKEAPIHMAVFVESEPIQGRGLGRQTMPESLEYSVVAAIQNFWLAARSEGIGVGWVSILRPDKINNILSCNSSWRLVAYLCVGYPAEEHMEPELQRLGWENRASDFPWIVR